MAPSKRLGVKITEGEDGKPKKEDTHELPAETILKELPITASGISEMTKEIIRKIKGE